MNSVASQNVATLMNSKLGIQNHNLSQKQNGKNDFSAIFSKAKGPQYLNRKEFEAMSESKVKVNNKHGEVKADEVPKDEEQKKVPQNTEQKEVAEKDKAQVEEVDVPKEIKEVKEVKEVKSTQITSVDELKPIEEMGIDYSALETMALQIVSDILGISVNELTTTLNEMDVNVFDLLNMNGLSEVVSKVNGIEAVSEFLGNEEAINTLKALKSELEAFNKTYEISEEDLKQLVANPVLVGQEAVQVSAESEESVDSKALVVENEETQGLKVIVNDTRSQKNTTENNTDTSGKQEQQSFGNMLSQNVSVTKEVVMVNSSGDVTYQQVNTKDVIDQIVTKAIVNLSDTKTSMELQLNPGNLGKIAVSIVSEQGLIKGQFVAENQVVKEMLETNMAQLKTQLEQQGIKIDKIEVTLGNASQYFNQREQEQHQQQQHAKHSRQGRMNRLSRLHRMEMAEVEMKSNDDTVKKSTNVESTVEYSA